MMSGGCMLSHSDKPWTIVGAGPSGAMQALFLAAVMPNKEIYVLDRYRQHIRGHGLQLLNDTSRKIIACLNEAKAEAARILKAKHITPQDRKNYTQVLVNIEKTKKFLQKNCTGFITGPFIRTHVITDMFREFVENGLGNSNVKFLMENEVKRGHLHALVDGDAAADHVITPKDIQTRDILHQSEFIMGADGEHSRVREVVFGEKDADLARENMAYVIEIKLEMKSNADSLDIFKKTIYPTLVNGHLHVWSRGQSGTATLHVFVDREQYDLLKSKNNNGVVMGEFANPYRRLADIPMPLRKAINASIENVIGLDTFDENTLKITTLPMGTYTAKKLITQVNKKKYALVGDAGVGLVLERGVNNGLYSAAEFGLALFNLDVKRKYVKKDAPMVSSFYVFRDLHKARVTSYVQKLKDNYALTDANAEILKKRYEKFFSKIMSSPPLNHRDHTALVLKEELEFLRLVTRLVKNKKNDKVIVTAGDLFIDLKNNATVNDNMKNELDFCEEKIKARAVKVKAEIKVRFGFINFIKNLYGKLVSLYFSLKDRQFVSVHPAVHSSSLNSKYKELVTSLPTYDYNTQREQYMRSAEWTFNMDRLCFYLQAKIAEINKSAKPNKKKLDSLTQFLDVTIQFSQKMTDFIATNNKDSTQMDAVIKVWQAHLGSLKLADQPLIKAAERSSWKLTINIDNVTENVLSGFNAYLATQPKMQFTKKLGLFKGGQSLKTNAYQWLFNNPSLSELTKLCIIHGLLQDAGNKDLRDQIITLFPKEAHVSVSDIQDEIMKIIKMNVVPNKLNEFHKAISKLTTCIVSNAFPTAEMTANLDGIFSGSQDKLHDRRSSLSP
jgi:2-polyprenyl-6-methoxyphenol hydroxylase-like FAD-dependent oxidoreductase